MALGLFDRAFGAMGATYPADHDFWYHPINQGVTASGIPLSPEGAQKVSAFYRGVDLLSTTLAMLPFPIMRRLPDEEGAEPARDFYLYDVIQRKPNTWQNSFQWRREAVRRIIFRGNHYSWIVAGRRGFVDQLQPIYQEVKPFLINERKQFRVTQHDGTFKWYTQDDIFHLCGVSDDGVEGVGIVQWAKDSIGLAMATESYAARLFSQGSLYGTVLQHPLTLSPEKSREIAQSFREATSGLANAHTAVVLQQGMTAARMGLSGEETQFIDSRKLSIDDIARWLGLPPHMIGSLERSTNNNIEHQGQEFVTYSLGPWLTLFEQAVNDQLIIRPDLYFAEFTRDALVRGDISTRWMAYHTGVTDGVITRNEVRRKENWKKLPGLDEPLTPAHIVGKQDGNQKGVQTTKATRIAHEVAARILRKEARAVQKEATRKAGESSEDWAAWVAEFYDAHALLVQQALQIDPDRAAQYCAGQQLQLMTEGLTVLESWLTEDYAAGLAALALEDGQ
jgi:HK97 family phage portal protein